MQKIDFTPTGKYPALLLGILTLFGLYLTSLYDYLLFHSLSEIFSVIVGCGIFMVTWNARRFLDNSYLLFIGIAFLFVAGLDLLHTFAYQGMDIFSGFGSNLATQLWIAARYLESLSLLIAFLFLDKKLKVKLVLGTYLAVFALILISIFYWQNFPVCYLEASGSTAFKKISEYIISLLLLGSLLLLLKKQKAFDPYVVRLLSAAIILTILSELAFTLYISVYDFFNLLGHFFKIAAFYLIYRAIIVTGLLKPFNLLFRTLKESEKALANQVKELTLFNARLEDEISEKIQAQQEIRELNHQLQARVQELAVANRELEAFSYSASHDLRTPLTKIDGFSQMLLKYSAPQLDSQGTEFLSQIRKAIEDMVQLIDALLNLSKVREIAMHPKPVDLSELGREIARELQKTQPQRRVELIIADELKVQGDPRLLKILLENLLSNAWKFTGNREKVRIELGETLIKEKSTFFVRDNGSGFDMDFADKLFVPFKRLHEPSQFPGSGIGLAIVQRIVQRHGGNIWAEGQVDNGAVFYFTL